MIYYTTITLGDKYLGIEYIIEENDDGQSSWIDEVMLDDTPVDIDDPYLWAFIEETVWEGHEEVIAEEELARYGLK